MEFENLLLSITDVSKALVDALSGGLGVGYPILFNAIGVISIFLQFMIFQMANKKKIVFVGILSDIGWLLYFALQGDFISGTANIIGIMSKSVILLQSKHTWAGSKIWKYFFVSFAAVFSILTFQVWMDVFALIACSLSILAFFMTKENDIRKTAMFAFCAFACNSISKMYIVALIADLTALISIITSLIRYSKEDTKTEQK